MSSVSEKLSRMGACREAVEWSKKYRTDLSAWKACRRGDHMLWYCGKTSGPPDSDSRRKLVLVAAQCAELALPFARDEETRAICESTIQTCYAYAAGEAELTDVRSAYAAAASAYAAAAYAADDAGGAYARSKILAACADIVRDNYPESPL